MKIIQGNNKNIKEIIAALKNGAVLILPTDTVYGLVCDAKNEKAVEKIFKIKKRNITKSLPVFVQDIKMAKKYAVISKIQEKNIKEKWPGAFTFVLKGKKGLSPLVYKNNTIALRQPDYKMITGITRAFKKPLAQTSANISNYPATTKIKEVIKYFRDKKTQPDIIIDADNLKKNKPSVIIDLTKNKIKILRK
jgi:L-threonylcarbamoyladenylate synthase